MAKKFDSLKAAMAERLRDARGERRPDRQRIAAGTGQEIWSGREPKRRRARVDGWRNSDRGNGAQEASNQQLPVRTGTTVLCLSPRRESLGTREDTRASLLTPDRLESTLKWQYTPDLMRADSRTSDFWPQSQTLLCSLSRYLAKRPGPENPVPPCRPEAVGGTQTR